MGTHASRAGINRTPARFGMTQTIDSPSRPTRADQPGAACQARPARDSRQRRLTIAHSRGGGSASLAAAFEQKQTRGTLPGRRRPQALVVRLIRRRAASVEYFSFDWQTDCLEVRSRSGRAASALLTTRLGDCLLGTLREPCTRCSVRGHGTSRQAGRLTAMGGSAPRRAAPARRPASEARRSASRAWGVSVARRAETCIRNLRGSRSLATYPDRGALHLRIHGCSVAMHVAGRRSPGVDLGLLVAAVFFRVPGE